MSTCNHLWLRAWTLSGRCFEKCHECHRARMPRLGDMAAQAAMFEAMSRTLRRLYAGNIRDLMPRTRAISTLLDSRSAAP